MNVASAMPSKAFYLPDNAFHLMEVSSHVEVQDNSCRWRGRDGLGRRRSRHGQILRLRSAALCAALRLWAAVRLRAAVRLWCEYHRRGAAVQRRGAEPALQPHE